EENKSTGSVETQPGQAEETRLSNSSPAQLLNTYITVPTASGFLLIHQQAAHERILYEEFTNAAQGKAVHSQQSLFPVTLELAPADAAVLEELNPDLLILGYQLEPFGKNTYIIQGTPGDLEQGQEKQVIESLLEQYKHFSAELKLSRREKVNRALARQQSI